MYCLFVVTGCPQADILRNNVEELLRFDHKSLETFLASRYLESAKFIIEFVIVNLTKRCDDVISFEPFVKDRVALRIDNLLDKIIGLNFDVQWQQMSDIHNELLRISRLIDLHVLTPQYELNKHKPNVKMYYERLTYMLHDHGHFEIDHYQI